MKRLVLPVLLFLSGCATVPPELSSRDYLASLTKDASPVQREQKVGERSVILAAYGAYFLPSPIQDEVAKVMKHRRAHGQWPDSTELSAGGERWRISRQEDLLVLTREAGSQDPYPDVFVAADGFMGLDARYQELFRILHLVYLAQTLTARPQNSSPFPVIIVPRRY
jgi:hypothetical protein